MKTPMIECPRCKGLKRVPLDGPLAETLEIVRKLRGADVFEVHSKITDKVSVTAVNNRLEDLRALGLLIRSKLGRRWIYRYTKLKPITP